MSQSLIKKLDERVGSALALENLAHALKVALDPNSTEKGTRNGFVLKLFDVTVTTWEADFYANMLKLIAKHLEIEKTRIAEVLKELQPSKTPDVAASNLTIQPKYSDEYTALRRVLENHGITLDESVDITAEVAVRNRDGSIDRYKIAHGVEKHDHS